MLEELTTRFVQAMGHSLWQGAAIGLGAWFSIRCFRKSPSHQHLILCGALALMTLALPFNLTILAPEKKPPTTPATASHRESRSSPSIEQVRKTPPPSSFRNPRLLSPRPRPHRSALTQQQFP